MIRSQLFLLASIFSIGLFLTGCMVEEKKSPNRDGTVEPCPDCEPKPQPKNNKKRP